MENAGNVKALRNLLTKCRAAIRFEMGKSRRRLSKIFTDLVTEKAIKTGFTEAHINFLRVLLTNNACTCNNEASNHSSKFKEVRNGFTQDAAIFDLLQLCFKMHENNGNRWENGNMDDGIPRDASLHTQDSPRGARACEKSPGRGLSLGRTSIRGRDSGLVLNAQRRRSAGIRRMHGTRSGSGASFRGRSVECRDGEGRTGAFKEPNGCPESEENHWRVTVNEDLTGL